jgi:hypothetical protein
MPDLVAGFATFDGAGAVAIHRGNIDALWPYTAAPPIRPRSFRTRSSSDYLRLRFSRGGRFHANGH